MNKKWIIAPLILVAAGVITFLLWPKAELPEPRIELPEIKIADTAPLLTFIAIEKGFFEKEGLQVKLERMWPENGVSALLAGEVDYINSLGVFAAPPIEASLRKAPIKTIMLTARHQESYIIAQPELELNDLKTIGILSQPPLYYQALKFIEENGLEVEIITVGTLNEIENLFSLGRTDAIIRGWGSAIQLQAQGFPILDILIDELPSGLAARDDKIKKEPEEVEKMIRALEKTMEFIVTEPEETKRLFLKYWDLEETEENLAVTEEYYPIIKSAYDRRGVHYDEGADLLIQIAKADKPETLQEIEEQIITQEEFDKVFDFRFVE